MQPRYFEAIIFSAKAAVAAVISALCYKFFQLPAVLVTQPDLHSSFQASFMRVVANLAGAFGGAALLAATGQPITAMAIGVLVTGLVCYLIKQDDALRPAFVAVIIVTLIGGGNEWHSSRDRVTGVIIGCVCALIVGFLFDKISNLGKLRSKERSKKSGQSE